MMSIHMTFSKKTTPLHSTQSTHSTYLLKIFFTLLTLSTAFLLKAGGPGKYIKIVVVRIIGRDNVNTTTSTTKKYIKIVVVRIIGRDNISTTTSTTKKYIKIVVVRIIGRDNINTTTSTTKKCIKILLTFMLLWTNILRNSIVKT